MKERCFARGRYLKNFRINSCSNISKFKLIKLQNLGLTMMCYAGKRINLKARLGKKTWN